MTAQRGQGWDMGAQKAAGASKGRLIQLGSGGSKQASRRWEHLFALGPKEQVRSRAGVGHLVHGSAAPSSGNIL